LIYIKIYIKKVICIVLVAVICLSAITFLTFLSVNDQNTNNQTDQSNLQSGTDHSVECGKETEETIKDTRIKRSAMAIFKLPESDYVSFLSDFVEKASRSRKELLDAYGDENGEIREYAVSNFREHGVLYGSRLGYAHLLEMAEIIKTTQLPKLKKDRTLCKENEVSFHVYCQFEFYEDFTLFIIYFGADGYIYQFEYYFGNYEGKIAHTGWEDPSAIQNKDLIFANVPMAQYLLDLYSHEFFLAAVFVKSEIMTGVLKIPYGHTEEAREDTMKQYCLPDGGGLNIFEFKYLSESLTEPPLESPTEPPLESPTEPPT